MVDEDVESSDYIVVTTKNCLDIMLSIGLSCAGCDGGSHGYCPYLERTHYREAIIISAVSLGGTEEKGQGNIIHDDHDVLIVGPFQNSKISSYAALAAAKEFFRNL